MTSETADHLQRGPFGDAAGLARDRASFYRHLSHMMSLAFGIRIELDGHDHQLLAASVTRAALDRGFRDATQAAEDAAGIRRGLETAFKVADERRPPLEVVDGYALAAKWDSSPAGRALLEAVARDLAPQTFTYREPTMWDAARLRAGINVLFDTMGSLASDVLACVNGALLVESSSVESAFIVPVPMVSVLNVSVLDDKLDTADAVFHEACHQKFYDLILVRRLLRTGYRYLDGPLFDIPWTPVSGRPRQMDGLRILSTLHVYTHLMVLLAEYLKAGHDTAPAALTKASDYWERSQYFRTLARESIALRQALGADGPAFLDWLLDAMSLVEADLNQLGVVAQNAFVAAAMQLVERG